LTGVAGALCLAQGGYSWSNLGALLIVVSNFVDHTDGELARISGKTSRFGHFYDLACDVLVTVLLFAGLAEGVGSFQIGGWTVPPAAPGLLAGVAIALTFFLRMRIEAIAGKGHTRQASRGGFETEDVLYLLPLVTLTGGTMPFVAAAAIGAPLFAAWVVLDYRRAARRARPASGPPAMQGTQ
jgi:phosphatidylglycerophosphate synthase